MTPWKKKKWLMPNLFIFVLQPGVVPPNQYMIHKYPRAPCSRQESDDKGGEGGAESKPASNHLAKTRSAFFFIGQKLRVEE